VGDERHGYGTRTARDTMERLRDLGVNTLGILLEGRMSSRTAPEVHGPGRDAVEATRAALRDAHALGFATVLVPHLYVDDGTWRGDLAWTTDEDAELWWRTYGAFIGTAAALADATGASLLAVGVELKAMSAEPETRPRIARLIERVRGIYDGPLTYAANWDEAEDVGFWDLIDIPGVNGYYPLEPTPARGAEAVARRLHALSERAGEDVLVIEVGYRSSPLSHLEPWAWPEQIEPVVDRAAQARAWAAVLTHWLDAPGIRGLMAWVIPSAPDDPASEPPHGFNPLNKPAERVIGQAFGGRPDPG
jgi:hypothetical protein